MDNLHAFEMTRHRYLRCAAKIIFLFFLLMSSIADLNESDSSLRCVALLLLLIISSKTNHVGSLVGLTRVSSSLILLIVFPANVSAEEGDWSTEWSSWSHKKVGKHFFKRLVIKIVLGSNQEAVSDCKGKTEGGIGMYACCMHHLEEIVAVNLDSNEI